MTTQQKIVIEADEGESVDLGGLGVDFKVPGAMTGGAFSIVEHPLDPGRLIPPHIHYREDELSYVLRGEIVQPAEIRFLARRDLEHALEGAHFDWQRHAVRLRHLGGERRHRDGEGDRAVSRRLGALTDKAVPQRRQRIAHRGAARLDSDHPCYCIPWHRHSHIGILGQHEEVRPQVAPDCVNVA